jgi:predicted DNA-binding antitoxin AbrB/MazE fold protein
VQHLGARLGRVVIDDRAGERLPVVARHAGLGIEQVEMARAALHEHRDHRPRLRLEVRPLRRQIEPALLELRPAGSAEESVLVQEPGQGQAADAEGGPGKEVAAGEIAGVVVHGSWLPKSCLHCYFVTRPINCKWEAAGHFGVGIMAIEFEAVYENGVLKPTTVLPLKEHEKVQGTIQTASSLARQTAGMIPRTECGNAGAHRHRP